MALRTLLVLLAALARGFAQPAPPVTLSVHLLVACSSQGAGQPAVYPGVEVSQCLGRTPFLTEKDVRSAEFHWNPKGRPVVFLTFRDDAAIRELEVTRQNAGHRVAIVVNGRLAAVPSIATGSRFLYIDGGYTEKQVRALVAAFNRGAANR